MTQPLNVFPLSLILKKGGGTLWYVLNQQYKKRYYFRLSLHANSNIRALPAFKWEQNLKLMWEWEKRGVPKQEIVLLIVSAILAIYLRNILLYTDDEATVIYHTFVMLCYFFPIFGAMLADTLLGKFRWVFIFKVGITFWMVWYVNIKMYVLI